MDSDRPGLAHIGRRWWQSGWFIRVVVGVVFASGFLVATAVNAFGENIHGTVHCTNGPVTGVFIEADRLPRVWSTSKELQSGFARWNAMGPVSAEFDYWLPYGGAYSIHFGCGWLEHTTSGVWATDNRTPIVRGSGQEWWCDNPVYTGVATIVVMACWSD